MIEVHPPEHAPHGVRDFLLHIFTITVGLLIALGLENFVEWRHHVHLKHQAEENIRMELRANQSEMNDIVAAIPRETESLQQIEVLMKARLEGKTPEVHSIHTGMMQVTPQSAAWNTASATGALSYMQYDEVERFSSAYSLQGKFERFEDAAIPPLLNIMASLKSNDPTKLSAEQAQAVLNDVHLTMAHLYATAGLAKDVNKAYDKALNEK